MEQVWEGAAVRQPPKEKMTYEEFLAWADEDTYAEWVKGPADLVVEVVSPESASRARGEKFYEYEAPGISEYWLIDPMREVGEFYRLEKGHYQPVLVGREGVFRSSVVPGFWLKVEWLWQDPLPRLLDVLRELGLV